jgi:hypothetical protein
LARENVGTFSNYFEFVKKIGNSFKIWTKCEELFCGAQRDSCDPGWKWGQLKRQVFVCR